MKRFKIVLLKRQWNHWHKIYNKAGDNSEIERFAWDKKLEISEKIEKVKQENILSKKEKEEFVQWKLKKEGR